jgi:hypothetical protein
MMSAEFGIRYTGEGWLRIIKSTDNPAATRTAPDVTHPGSSRSGEITSNQT